MGAPRLDRGVLRSFGTALRNWRLSVGLSQAQLQSRLGLDETGYDLVSRMERGLTCPNRKVFTALLDLIPRLSNVDPIEVESVVTVVEPYRKLATPVERVLEETEGVPSTESSEEETKDVAAPRLSRAKRTRARVEFSSSMPNS